eukprot:scaffold7755_cov104-Cylindrotheca_fusiformis.AAC.7
MSNERTWKCSACTLENPFSKRRCNACQRRRPVDLVAPADGSIGTAAGNRNGNRKRKRPSENVVERKRSSPDDDTNDQHIESSSTWGRSSSLRKTTDSGHNTTGDTTFIEETPVSNIAAPQAYDSLAKSQSQNSKSFDSRLSQESPSASCNSATTITRTTPSHVSSTPSSVTTANVSNSSPKDMSLTLESDHQVPTSRLQEKNTDSKSTNNAPVSTIPPYRDRTALKKTTTLLKEENNDNPNSIHVRAVVDSVIFQTAGTGARINVTDESLGKAEALLQAKTRTRAAGPPLLNRVMDTSFQNEGNYNASTTGSIGFQTAGSCLRIHVTEDSLERAQTLLEKATPVAPNHETGTARLVGFQNAENGPRIDLTEEESLGRTDGLLHCPTLSNKKVRATLGKKVEERSALDFSASDTAPLGFQTTGSDKRIQVTEESLGRTETLLHKASIAGIPPSSRSALVGFQTAGSGKGIQVTDESLCRAETLLQKASIAGIPHENAVKERGAVSRSANETAPVGFQTAGSGKRIQVTEESRSRAETLLQEASIAGILHENTVKERGAASRSANDTVRVGFQTVGSGKRIQVTDESLSRAETLLQEASIAGIPPENAVKARGASNRSANETVPIGFQTAGSDKRIQVTDESLSRAETLLQEASIAGIPHENAVKERGTVSRSANDTARVGFQTAGSGKRIQATDESLSRAETLLQEASIAGIPLENAVKGGASNHRASNTARLGFQTAESDKRIQVTDESLSRAEALLQKYIAGFDHKMEERGASNRCASDIAPVGFQTAGSGKRIQVTEESLGRAETILQKASIAGLPLENAVKGGASNHSASNTARLGFQTAESDKRIHVTEEALGGAEAVLQKASIAGFSFDHKVEERGASNRSAKGVGFQTAGSGKRIQVTEESLGRAETLLQKADIAGLPLENAVEERGASNHSASDTAPVGFQTAGSGKRIQVAEELLGRAENLLQNSITGFPFDHKVEKRGASNRSASNTAPVGFQTAGSGKRIQVTEESLGRAETLLQKANIAGLPLDDKVEAPVGFQTAGSGKRIQVTEESLVKARIALHEVSVDLPRANKLTESNAANDSTGIDSPVNFRTVGSSEPIHLLDVSLDKADSPFRESNVGPSLEYKLGESSALDHHTSSGGPVGFQTARSGALDHHTSRDGPVGFQTAGSGALDHHTRDGPVGFQTAGSGAPIEVSNESLLKAETLLQKTRGAPLLANHMEEDSAFDGYTGSGGAVSFESAGSGAPIDVSKEALLRTESLLQKTRGLPLLAKRFEENGALHDLTSSDGPVGFETAGSGAPIDVSRESLLRAEILLQKTRAVPPLLNDIEDDGALGGNTSSDGPVGFETAGSGAPIDVSKESLLRAETLLQKTRAVPSLENETEEKGARTSGRYCVVRLQTAGGSALIRKDRNVAAAAQMGLTSSGLLSGYVKSLDNAFPPVQKIAGSMTLEDSKDTIRFSNCNDRATVSLKGVDSVATSLTREENAVEAVENCSPRSWGCFPPANKSMLEVEECRKSTPADKGDSTAFATTCQTNIPVRCEREQASENDSESLHDREQRDISNAEEAIPCVALVGALRRHGCTESMVTSQSEEESYFMNGPSITNEAHRETGNSMCKTIGAVAPVTPLPDAGTQCSQSTRRGSVRRVTYGMTSSSTRNTPHSGTGEAALTSNVRKGFLERFSANINNTTPEACTNHWNLAKVTMSAHSSPAQTKKSGCRNVMTPVPINFGKYDTTDDMPSEYTQQPVPNFSNEVYDSSSLQEALELGEMTNNEETSILDGVSKTTMDVTSSNGGHVHFDVGTGLPSRIYTFSDGASSLSQHEIQTIRGSLIHIGCSSERLNEKWIANHKRWVVWKLASYERRFSRFLAGQCLLYQNLIKHLRKRYSKEIENGHRPAIRKILNRDAAANRLMILAVSRILAPQAEDERSRNVEDGIVSSPLKLELTDGWYSIQATVDNKLMGFVHDGVIKSGTKLLISGAKLHGADDGIDPLDESYQPSDPSCQIALSICANSTRLAKWNAKLGFVNPNSTSTPHGLLLVKKISDVLPGGGEVPVIRVRVLRRYPMLYLEKCQELSSNDSRKLPILSEPEEECRRKDFEKRVLRAIERLTDDIQKDVEKASIV